MTPDQLDALADQVDAILPGTLTDKDYHALLKTLGFRRPFKDSNTGWANVLDQVLHVAYAMIVLLPLVAWPSYAGAALTAFLLAVIREYEQYKNWDWELPLLANRTLDVLSFVAGGLLLYVLVQSLAGG